MSTQVQRRKGTTAQHASFTGASAELTVDTTKNTVVVHNGATAGGIPLAKETGSAISATSLSSSSTLGVTGVSTLTGGALIQGLTVGRGAGAIATNTAVGASALAANTTGGYSTAVGYNALDANTTGLSNNAFGFDALGSVITGTQNNGFGVDALKSTTGSYNVAMGHGAASANTSGANNTAIGTQALTSNTTASNNTAVGYQALYTQSGTTGPNTALGFQAGYANTTGTNNLFNGYQAGVANTSGLQNVYVGFQAGSTVTTGNNNIYLGANTVASGVSASQEIVIGAAGGTGKGSNTGFINPNGGGVYQGNNAATWSITSDQRIKKNIVDNNTGLNVINQIQVRNFEYRLPEEVTGVAQDQAIKKQGVQLGVIAQELQQILPECVKTESTGVMTVDTDNLTWYLINAVKELSTQVAQLQLKGK